MQKSLRRLLILNIETQAAILLYLFFLLSYKSSPHKFVQVLVIIDYIWELVKHARVLSLSRIHISIVTGVGGSNLQRIYAIGEMMLYIHRRSELPDGEHEVTEQRAPPRVAFLRSLLFSLGSGRSPFWTRNGLLSRVMWETDKILFTVSIDGIGPVLCHYHFRSLIPYY